MGRVPSEPVSPTSVSLVERVEGDERFILYFCIVFYRFGLCQLSITKVVARLVGPEAVCCSFSNAGMTF